MKSQDDCESIIERIRSEEDIGRHRYRIDLVDQAARLGCREVKPFLLRYLVADNPFLREEGLRGLKDLGAREERPRMLDLFHKDPDSCVRQTALVCLDMLFLGEADNEILQMALKAFEDKDSDIGMRLAAGAVMMHQLQIPHDEQGGPAWWNEDEPEWLEHPSILRAVQDTKKLFGVS